MDLLDCACGAFESFRPEFLGDDRVQCPGCLACTPPCGSPEAAARLWNAMQAEPRRAAALPVAPVDLSTLSVGDAYRLRSGRLLICAEIRWRPNTRWKPEHAQWTIRSYGSRGECEWAYRQDGAVYARDATDANPLDIVQVIKGGQGDGSA